jgi:hypothetical protein
MTQNKISVLDLGHVEYISSMGSDLTVVNAARVSFNQESEWDIDQEAKQRLTSTESSYHESDLRVDRKSTRLNSSHSAKSRMPSSA